MLPVLIKGERSAAAAGFTWLDDRHRQAERPNGGADQQAAARSCRAERGGAKPVLDQSVGSGGVGHP
jgi:hypothetical protein